MITTTQKMKAILDAEHFRYRRFATGAPAADEIALDTSWQLTLEAPRTPLLDRMLADFAAFCERCMQITFGKNGHKRVRWKLVGEQSTLIFDRQDRSIEAFTITVGEKEITIEARHERGLLHATHYLERQMADRGAPWLKCGRLERAPRFAPRISNGVFIPGEQKPTDLGEFSDEYLSLMSHFGANGIHLYVNLWDLCRNTALPEVNTPEFEKNIAALNAFNERTLRFGIDLYLHLNTRLFPPDHTVFQRHPGVRGARVDIFLEELESIEHYNLCSGHPRVLDCYSETLESLFSAAPNVAGAVVIVGGECFFHCFTRPGPSAEGHTSCPCCRSRNASEEVARLANTLAAAVKRTGRHKLTFAWPYSAFVWSGKDRAQLQWIDQLDGDVSVLSVFDTGVEDRANGDGVFLFDYNIKLIGPSDVFAAQAGALRAKGRPIFTKTETNTTPESFFVPYLPVHHRWHARFQAMAAAGVAGFIGQWRFYGMNGSPPEELQYQATWNPERNSDSLLATMAQRDFGIAPDAATQVVAAWRTLGEAWEAFPYSAMMGGERWAYMRGPFFLGPSHPLILDPQNLYRLGPQFRQLRGDAFEMLSGEPLESAIRNAPPRYVSDLLFTAPFGVERCDQLLTRCIELWQAGFSELDRILAATNERGRAERDVCHTILIHLTTTRNVLRFYRTRDRLWQQKIGRKEFAMLFAELTAIAQSEIANTEPVLPILARDPRIGYGHCYGTVYDAEMVNQKLRQCRYLVEKELPRLSSLIRFHLWLDYP